MATAKLVFSPASIMRKAWTLARFGARRFGGTVRPYLAAALRQAWAEAKATAATIAAQQERVAAEVAKIKVEQAARATYAPTPRPSWGRCRVGAPARDPYRFPIQGGLRL